MNFNKLDFGMNRFVNASNDVEKYICFFIWQVELVDSSTEHNTHVANGTGSTIFVEVQGPDGLKSHVINPGDVVNFGTAKGEVTITVYYNDKRDHYEAVKQVPSDISVVVGCVDGKLHIARVKYGSLWQIDEWTNWSHLHMSSGIRS